MQVTTGDAIAACMIAGWVVGAWANAVIAVAYFAVAGLLAVSITRTKQWFANPLASATAFIFFSCAGGHLIHALQLAGTGGAAADGERLIYEAPYMWGWDVLTALAAVVYFSMRRRFPDLVGGTALFEDLRVRQRRALQINDDVVQGLVRAKLDYDLGRDADGRAATSEVLEASRRIAAELGGAEEARSS